MAKTETEKLINRIEIEHWCDYVNPAERVIGIYNDTKSLRFANYSPALKKITKKFGFKVQYVIK